MSAFGGGLNGSTQHSILKGKDGVFGNASRLFSRLYGIRENRALGSLAAGRVCPLSGAKRTYRDGDLMRSWFADHAAMRLEEAPAGAARRDPSIKWEFLILQF
jgi:hypothetical protein